MKEALSSSNIYITEVERRTVAGNPLASFERLSLPCEGDTEDCCGVEGYSETGGNLSWEVSQMKQRNVEDISTLY